MTTLLAAAVVIALCTLPALALGADLGPGNPFFAPSSLPFQAPPFDKIKDEDYQPAIEAGMAEERKEVQAIADNPAPPTFENTIDAMEKSGQLLRRVRAVFFAVVGANTNPALQKVRAIEAPKLAAHQDAIYLDAKLFQRVATIYKERAALKLDPESLRLVEWYYKDFVHAGANLSDSDKIELKKLNEESATLSNAFSTKLLDATKAAAYMTTDKEALAGLSNAQISAAAEAAKSRGESPGRSWTSDASRAPTVAGSKSTRSAWYPTWIWPRSRRPNSCAGCAVSMCTAFSTGTSLRPRRQSPRKAVG